MYMLIKQNQNVVVAGFRPKTHNPKIQKSKIQNPKPKTQNLKSQIQNSKPKIQIVKFKKIKK